LHFHKHFDFPGSKINLQFCGILVVKLLTSNQIRWPKYSLKGHELLNSAYELATNTNNHSGGDDDNDHDKSCYFGTCTVTLKEREREILARTGLPRNESQINIRFPGELIQLS